MEPSPRQRADMIRQIRLHNATESNRTRQLDLLLDAGVPLEEALQLVGK